MAKNKDRAARQLEVFEAKENELDIAKKNAKLNLLH